MPMHRRWTRLSQHMSTVPASSASTSASAPPVSNVVFQIHPHPSHRLAVSEALLNRPSKLNSLDLGMVRDLARGLAAAPAGLIVLEGAGDRAFCAGGDVASIQKQLVSGQGSLAADFFYDEYKLDYALASSPRHVQVSIWNGVTMGGGVGLSIHGRFRVATEKTLFAMPETGIGFFPDVGATHALPRLRAGPEVGLYLALTGARLNPGNCLLTGVATHYCPSTRIPDLKAALRGLDDPSDAVKVAGVLEAMADETALKSMPASTLGPHLDAIKRCFSQPSAEAIVDALRGESSEWAQATLKQMHAGSPLLVKVTVEALKRHGDNSVTLKQAFATEYRMSQHTVRPASDFVEGIRAVLVDRDNKPQWKYASLADVPNREVQACFGPLPPGHSRGELWA